MTLMPRNVLRRLTSLVLAGVLLLAAVTVTAAPARANDDVLLKFLLGAAGIAILVHAFSDREKPRNWQYQPNILPDHCRETLHLNRREIGVYNARCLSDAGLRNLPQRCHEVVRTNRGQRAVYRERCLLQAGYHRAYAPLQHRPQIHPYPGLNHGPNTGRLPRSCALDYSYRGQRHHGYSADCLDRAGYRDLPATCLLRGARSGAQVRIYSAQCLTV